MIHRYDKISPNAVTKLETMRWRLGLSYHSRFKRSIRIKRFYQELRWRPLPKRVIGAARRNPGRSGWVAV